MAIDIRNYKCPACTGPLMFSGAMGRLECEYCGGTYDIYEFENLNGDGAQTAAQTEAEESAETETPDNWDDENVRVYICSSCGAELICDVNTAATNCPYCGNSNIMSGQLSGAMKPDLVLPFQLKKENAVAALNNYYKGKRFLPDAFAAKNHIEEIKGVYVPFWLFDGAADVKMSYHATRSHSRVSGDYEIINTEHYIVRREGVVNFSRIPVDASTKMPDDYMEAIEPFHYQEMKRFKTAYLAGYMADKYDVSAEESEPRANRRAETTAENVIAGTVSGYSTRIPTGKSIDIHNNKAKYVLLPVWLLSTNWKGQRYLFAINGQTGKLVGDLPIDKVKYLKTFAAIAAPLMALMTAILYLF